MGDFIEDVDMLPSTCYTCTRLNKSTFRIVEDDIYHEYPFIYVKITRHAIVLIDTGCGGATNDSTIQLTSLRKFLEEYPVTDNDDRPLNTNGEKDYMVICTHCHYDHICGIEDFVDSDSGIIASAYDKEFLSKENLPTHSLCKFLDIPTPQYKITDWAADCEELCHEGEGLGPVVYHAPGHTPDELTVWDEDEHVLLVGDSVYEWAPIIFPKEGDLVKYSESLGKMIQLVEVANVEAFRNGSKRASMACGHCTHNADAAELLAELDEFLWDVVRGKVKVSREEEERGELRVLYEKEGVRLSFLGPQGLFEQFAKNEKAMDGLRKRVEKG